MLLMTQLSSVVDEKVPRELTVCEVDVYAQWRHVLGLNSLTSGAVSRTSAVFDAYVWSSAWRCVGCLATSCTDGGQWDMWKHTVKGTSLKILFNRWLNHPLSLLYNVGDRKNPPQGGITYFEKHRGCKMQSVLLFWRKSSVDLMSSMWAPNFSTDVTSFIFYGRGIVPTIYYL